jgi:hypothetical protein
MERTLVWASVRECHPKLASLGEMGLIRNEALVQALIEIGVVPSSTTNVQISTTVEADGFVRLAYQHTEDDGTPVLTTGRIIDAHARGLDRLSWESLLSEPPELPLRRSRHG